MANFDFVHPEYSACVKQWRENRDAVAGENAIKAGKEAYLPNPTPTDKSPEAQSRYDNYLARALYFNAAGRTVEGMVGIAFGEWPEYELPTTLEYVVEDIDGAGVGMMGQAQMAVSELLTTGRGGLLADYPSMDTTASVEDVASGRAAARVVWYQAEAIRDWATTKEGSRTKLTYVKLAETREQRSADGYEIETVPVYRVLRLDGGRYTVEILVKLNGGWTSEGVKEVLDGQGRPFDEIPFQFIGSMNNDPKPDRAPLTDLVKVNLAHYRNSADYEESVFMLGQPQVTMTGLDEQWRDHIEESGVYFGSRRVLMGPQGATIGLLQVQPNTLAADAMKAKQELMVSLGARLLQPGSSVKTAEQSRSETRAAYSVLSLICDNVSEAYRRALAWASRFMGSGGKTDFAISTDFNGLTFDTEVLKALMDGVQKGLIPKSDAWAYLRGIGVIDAEKTDEEIKDEIESEGGGLMDALARATLPGTGAPGGGGGTAPPGAPGPTPPGAPAGVE